MARPLKYTDGPLIGSVGDLVEHISAGGYVIDTKTDRRIHPGWVSSWQLRLAMSMVRRGRLRRARPNPDHPENRGSQ